MSHFQSHSHKIKMLLMSQFQSHSQKMSMMVRFFRFQTTLPPPQITLPPLLSRATTKESRRSVWIVGEKSFTTVRSTIQRTDPCVVPNVWMCLFKKSTWVSSTRVVTPGRRKDNGFWLLWDLKTRAGRPLGLRASGVVGPTTSLVAVRSVRATPRVATMTRISKRLSSITRQHQARRHQSHKKPSSRYNNSMRFHSLTPVFLNTTT